MLIHRRAPLILIQILSHDLQIKSHCLRVLVAVHLRGIRPDLVRQTALAVNLDILPVNVQGSFVAVTQFQLPIH